MPFTIVRGDITRTGAEAVVNAANTSLAAGGGVCGAIFSAAGYADLQAACDRIGHCETGGSAVTPGFALSRWIIHAVGPVWQGGRNNEEYLLRSAYRSALEKAVSVGAQTVAFPLISSGVYGYPPEEALAAAVSEIGAFLTHSDLDVTLVIYGSAPFALPAHLRQALGSYLDGAAPLYSLRPQYAARPDIAPTAASAAPTNMASTAPAGASAPKQKKRSLWPRRKRDTTQDAELPSFSAPVMAPREDREESASDAVSAVFSGAESLEAMLQRPGESFSHMLLRLIDESGRTDADVYRRANLDRRLFSKIRSNPDYQPSKATVLALAVSLRLDLDRTLDLLRSAGYALSPASRRDRIVEYFLRSENWNIFELNEVLFSYDEPALGA